MTPTTTVDNPATNEDATLDSTTEPPTSPRHSNVAVLAVAELVLIEINGLLDELLPNANIRLSVASVRGVTTHINEKPAEVPTKAASARER